MGEFRVLRVQRIGDTGECLSARWVGYSVSECVELGEQLQNGEGRWERTNSFDGIQFAPVWALCCAGFATNREAVAFHVRLHCAVKPGPTDEARRQCPGLT